MNDKKFSLSDRLRSFRYALNGIRLLFQKEHNARIHLAAAAVVIGAGFVFKINPTEWIAILLCIALVIGMEALNSAIEKLADVVSPQHSAQIKRVKDISAGAVLICAVIALIVGCIVFIPKIWS